MEIRKVRDKYFANEIGEVFDENMNKLSVFTNELRYKFVQINGKSTPVHRLMLEAFYGKDPDPERNYGNHIDTDPSNNHYLNLDWVTQHENNIHASLMKEFNRRPKAYSIKDGRPIKTYMNLKEIAIDLNISIRDAWLAIKNKTEICGVKLIFLSIADVIPNRLVATKKMDHVNQKTAIKMKSIITGEELFFPSFHAASLHFKTSKHHIWYAIRRDDFRAKRFFKKEYQVAYQEDDYDELTEQDILKATTHGPREVMAYNFKEKVYVLFENAKRFYHEIGSTKDRIMSHLAKDNIKRQGDWIFLYNNTNNVLRLKEYVLANRT